MKVAVITVGCRTNQAESLALQCRLTAEGHEVVQLSDSPDLCIVNTCSVTSKADADSRRLIMRAINTGVRTVATGCYADLHHVDMEKAHPRDGLQIVRNSEKGEIIKMLGLSHSSASTERRAGFRTRHIIKVQEGCNQACSYCIVPRVRGHSRSVALEEVMAEVMECEEMGSREIVLSGTHLGMYGIDLTPPVNLVFLLTRLLKQCTIPRIRLSSLEPKEVDEELLDLLSDTRICKHLHVPLQSGDDNILKSMNRPYNVGEFRRISEAILEKFPEMALGTDVIAGFPGEGDGEFSHTLSLLEELPLMYLHAFSYSARPGTHAALLDGQVTVADKTSRLSLLRELSARKRSSYIQRYQGRIVDVVVEKAGRYGFAGTSNNYIKVLLGPGRDLSVGMLVDVEITGEAGGAAFGTPATRAKLTQ
ncbi:MAG: MiaB/RimO family radical SAM methylthiotransferase [Chloroflexota bacterium]